MKLKKYNSINVVPFIDIMLVLLVIVLTTASFVAKGLIPIDLSSSKSTTKYKIKPKELIITIQKDGSVYFDKKQVARNKIENKLQDYKKDTIISINCDKESRFDSFVHILDILKSKNFKSLGIITKNEQ